MTSKKFTISSLPLSPSKSLLIHRLTPDPHTPSPKVFRSNVLTNTPSIQRRARLLSPQAHFSFVNPFPFPFPYDIEPPADEQVTDKGAFIETWLAAREAVHERESNNKIFDPKLRETPRVLLGIAPTALEDCLPNLDVGDSFSHIGTPALVPESEEHPTSSESAIAARNELIDILSGYSVLNSSPDFAPWSLRYSGHQFGSWAGQLGDGRAISIFVTPHSTSQHIEFQLKGAGRTPFSRTADGLAVLRSSIREYLCSEALTVLPTAMSALKIPTTRALSLVSFPSLPVSRERTETACVLTRLAPSFIRIGSFEAFNGPTNMFFFGGGQQKPDWEGLRILGEWVRDEVLRLDVEEGKPWAWELVQEVARRNAKMVAGWQAYGFMHGVINTDNVSILGLTIDYGPYAFMDIFDPFHICNHSDESGRYAYKYQPNMIIYALRALLTSLAPLIGYELATGKAAPPGWADSFSSSSPESKEANTESTASAMTLSSLTTQALQLQTSLEALIQSTTSLEYGNLLRSRLGLRFSSPTDETTLFKPLLDIMESQKLDFHGTFRALGGFRGSLLDGEEVKQLDGFIRRLVNFCEPGEETKDWETKREEWVVWLQAWKMRREMEEERALWGVGEDHNSKADVEEEMERLMRSVNPRFVLRQWVLEEVIKKVEEDQEGSNPGGDGVGRRHLAKILQMSTHPFDSWGAEGDARPDEELGLEEKEERRFCGIGQRRIVAARVEVTDIGQEAIRDPVQDALSVSEIEERDLYTGPITQNLLVYHLNRFALAARVEDFNAKDVTSPEKERTLILLSAFINFVKFTEQYCNPFVKDLRDRSEGMIVERGRVSESLAQIEQTIGALKAKIAEDEPRCEQLRSQNSALRAKMIATKEFQTTAVQEVEKLKAEKNALVKRKETLNNEIARIQDTMVRTRSRIVQSPERIKRTIVVMNTTAIDDKRTLTIQEVKARDLQTKVNALLNIEKDVTGCIEQLHVIGKEVQTLHDAQKELSDLRDRLDRKKIERNELKLRQEVGKFISLSSSTDRNTEQRVEKQRSNAQEKLERAQRHAEERKQASQRTTERLQQEYDQMAIERRDNDKQVEELRGEANEIEKKMNEQVKKGEAELNELLAEYWKLRHETDVYMETLANKLNMKVTSD
ncbi:hypothetical protein H0H93_012571 [Arthromyces matolae]|nr:hypothetical protein H0H93_012571 [Arthromyces matolae]